jgi:tRNA wybutosine-synthesizing protein 3
MLQSIPPAFAARKSKILSDLSVPDAEYTDLSPKGSVDEGIRDLIRDINGLDGLVTTSSCAGRTSVFVEGSKKSKSKTATPNKQDDNAVKQAEDAAERAGQKFAVSGGKGEGRWLFVSHDPVSPETLADPERRPVSYHALFGLEPGDGIPRTTASENENGVRLVRFHYDPMVRFFFISQNATKT